MAGDLVLITGATGHVGFRVLVLALQAGYHARLAVRSQSKADGVLAASSIKPLNNGSNISFVEVPDIMAEGAYSEAVKGVKYIIHLASPISDGVTDNFQEKLIQPAVKGTVGILQSALASPSVKRVVITSSIVAIIPSDVLTGKQSNEIFDGSSPFTPNTTGNFDSSWAAYIDSKVRALQATYDFLEQEKPPFDIVNINPSYIIGKNELVTSKSDFMHGTNKILLGPVLGAKSPTPFPGSTIWLNDVAKLHVLGLDSKIPGNRHYITNSGGLDGTTFNDVKNIVAEKYPEEVAKGLLPNNGDFPTMKVKVDASKTEEVFGFKFAGVETQVTELVDAYLELLKKEGAAL